MNFNFETLCWENSSQGCKMGRKSNCVICEIANFFSNSNCVSCEIAIPLSKSNCDCEKLRNRNCEKLRKIAIFSFWTWKSLKTLNFVREKSCNRSKIPPPSDCESNWFLQNTPKMTSLFRLWKNFRIRPRKIFKSTFTLLRRLIDFKFGFSIKFIRYLE